MSYKGSTFPFESFGGVAVSRKMRLPRPLEYTRKPMSEAGRARMHEAIIRRRAEFAGRGLAGTGKSIAVRSLAVAAAEHGIRLYRIPGPRGSSRIRLDFPFHGVWIDVGASNVHLQTDPGVLMTKGQMRAIRRSSVSLM